MANESYYVILTKTLMQKLSQKKFPHNEFTEVQDVLDWHENPAEVYYSASVPEKSRSALNYLEILRPARGGIMDYQVTHPEYVRELQRRHSLTIVVPSAMLHRLPLPKELFEFLQRFEI